MKPHMFSHSDMIVILDPSAIVHLDARLSGKTKCLGTL